MSRAPTSHLVRDQASGIAIELANNARQQSEILRQAVQDQAFQNATKHISSIRDFIGTPENIQGNPLTKHGIIAEHVEVGVRNAKAELAGLTLPAEKVADLSSPVDYTINGVDVQSKFINGASNNLTHVINHMDKYADFGRDGSYYHIPKDHYETIERVLNGENVDGLNSSTIEALKRKAEQIEAVSGRPFQEVVKPGVSEYAEVQQGKIHETLDRHQAELEKDNQQKKEQIHQEHAPSLQEGLKATGTAAAVAGALSLGTGIYSKYKQGKNLFRGDFTADDWKEIGISTAKGAVGGAVAGGAIYLMTNYAGMSAPFAGAVVSAIKGVNSLAADLNEGTIDFEEFMELGLIVCSESAIVGLATIAGQTLIPVPVLGAVIGSLAGKMLAEFATGKTDAIAESMRKDMQLFLSKVDLQYQSVVQHINNLFDQLGELTEAAFDLSLNAGLLERSVALARAYNVTEDKIIKSNDELDNFMLG